jgi:hypothetical protein
VTAATVRFADKVGDVLFMGSAKGADPLIFMSDHTSTRSRRGKGREIWISLNASTSLAFLSQDVVTSIRKKPHEKA